MSRRRRLFVALEVQGRPRGEIDGLRRGLGSRDLDRIVPHLTLVPPFNAPEARLGEVLGSLRTVAASFAPLRLVLGPPEEFRGRGVGYLAVSGELEELVALRTSLVTDLAPPGAVTEARPFVAHVTLASHLLPTHLEAVKVALSRFSTEVEFFEVTLFEREENDRLRRWSVLARVPLGPPFVHGRGGRELELSVLSGPDPEVTAFLGATPRDDGPLRGGRAQPGRSLAVTARLEGSLVGVAEGFFAAPVGLLLRLEVAEPIRRMGVGSAVLRRVEDEARAAGVVFLQVALDAGEDGAGFFSARGYSLAARLPPAESERPAVLVMTRRL